MQFADVTTGERGPRIATAAAFYAYASFASDSPSASAIARTVCHAGLAETRTRIGLMRPYGPRAERLRIGWALPPSERPRGKLKGQLLLAIPGP